MLIKIFWIFHDIVSLSLRNECTCRMGRTINFGLDDGHCLLFWVLLRPQKYQNLSNWSSTYIIHKSNILSWFQSPLNSDLWECVFLETFPQVSYLSFLIAIVILVNRCQPFATRPNTIRDGGGTAPIKRLHCLGVVHLLHKSNLGSREIPPPYVIL